MSQEIKEKFKADFEKLTDLVNAFDPCRLIALGAPNDEYEYLVNHILSFAYEKKSREEIKNMIIHELEFYYACLDLSVMNEIYKTKFYNDLDELLRNVEQRIS